MREINSGGKMKSLSPSVLPRIFSPSRSPAQSRGAKSESIPRKRRSQSRGSSAEAFVPQRDDVQASAEEEQATDSSVQPQVAAREAKVVPALHHASVPAVGSPWMRALYGTYEAVHHRLLTPGTTPGTSAPIDTTPEAGIFLVAASAVVLGQLTVLLLVLLVYLDVLMLRSCIAELSWALLFSVALSPSRDALLEACETSLFRPSLPSEATAYSTLSRAGGWACRPLLSLWVALPGGLGGLVSTPKNRVELFRSILLRLALFVVLPSRVGVAVFGLGCGVVAAGLLGLDAVCLLGRRWGGGGGGGIQTCRTPAAKQVKWHGQTDAVPSSHPAWLRPVVAGVIVLGGVVVALATATFFGIQTVDETLWALDVAHGYVNRSLNHGAPPHPGGHSPAAHLIGLVEKHASAHVVGLLGGEAMLRDMRRMTQAPFHPRFPPPSPPPHPPPSPPPPPLYPHQGNPFSEFRLFEELCFEAP